MYLLQIQWKCRIYDKAHTVSMYHMWPNHLQKKNNLICMLETLQMHWTYKSVIDTILSNIVHIVNRIINLDHFLWSTTHQFLTNKQDREKKTHLQAQYIH